ncbi:PP2C family protein-serine/threonine phosphatase [Actinomycetospora aeridis]|uniref:Protein phosphatase 2C domain-containing protein n=1 Tax=Actinomycetospora aeridis TaxID=3129231 RepID=A0ABU8MZ94_9PSEU
MNGYASCTEARSGRENHDRWAADPTAGWFVVADGIGSLADAGATAQVVVDRIAAGVPAGSTSALRTVLAGVSDHVRATARYGPGNAGAAVVVLEVRADTVLTAHLGDCRVLLLRAGRLLPLTADHRRDDGALTRFAGMPGPADPAVAEHRREPDDLLVLASDGLTVLDDAAIAAELADVAAGHRAPDTACAALVVRARAAGGTDDVTVLLVAPGTA